MTSRSHMTLRVWSAFLALAALVCGEFAFAEAVSDHGVKDRTEPLPKRLENVDVVEKPGAKLPLDAEFFDSTGESVRLGDFFDGHRPVIITFNYSDCPMLCSLQLNAFVNGLKRIKRTAGGDFRIVTLSIDPKEKPEKAAETKLRYLGDYGRPEAASGWHFLTAPEANTRAVADTAGFGYAYNEVRKEWIHAAALIVATPDGRVARYLYGVEYHPQTLELSLVEASDGKIASTVEQVLLYCFHYDESEGRYAPVAMNIMRVSASLVAIILGVVLAAFWRAERRKKKASARPGDTLSTTAAS